ncbi:hypothetical protein DVR12_05555 [Chitinophaga silvatica]|uniref:Uncharacterized protein n=1 Tax=Chitinophaga silvatica TaxID=2282649 RepID=A0A3E1YDV1_9BACT|nr:hypothetical protein DVR12_05555 [Chitinophaga silvatica]
MSYFKFRSLFLAYAFAILPLGIILSFLALFEIIPINYNNDNIVGLQGLIIGLIFTLSGVIMFTVINWLYLNVGCFLYNYFRKHFMD